MSWIIVIAIIIIGFCVLNGRKSRCPNCGFYGLNPIDKKRETEKKEYYPGFSVTALPFRPKVLRQHDRFKCKKCGHRFTRKTSTIWLKIENKLGKETALQEYQKLSKEMEEIIAAYART